MEKKRERILLFPERSTVCFFSSLRSWLHSWRKMAGTNGIGRRGTQADGKLLIRSAIKRGQLETRGGCCFGAGFHGVSCFCRGEEGGLRCELIRIDSRNEWKGRANVEKDETQTFQPPPCTISSPRTPHSRLLFHRRRFRVPYPWNRGFWPLEKTVCLASFPRLWQELNIIDAPPPPYIQNYRVWPGSAPNERGTSGGTRHSEGVLEVLVGDTGWNLINGNFLFFSFFNGCESAFFWCMVGMFALNEAWKLFGARDVCIRRRGDSTMNGFLYI